MRKIKYHSPDMVLFLVVFGLLCFGLIMLYSASALMALERYKDPYFFLKKQVVWVGIGSFFFILLAGTDYNILQEHSRIIMVVSAVLLTAVLIVGDEISGAKRWLRLGPIGFQPSELAKIAVILGLADYCDRRRSRLQHFGKGLVPALFILLGFCGLIAAEPDLGTPTVIVVTGLAILYMGGARFSHIMGLVLGAVPFFTIAVLAVPYRRQRFFAFLDPWADPQGSGYQIIQSLMALGSGGFTGKGLGASDLKRLYLPELHTDFIFPIIGEELGWFGSCLIITLFAVLVYRGARIANKAPNLFGRLVTAGIIFTLGFQAVINIAIASGSLPTKGLPLPFFSFGGSSLLFTLAGLGIVMNVSRQS